jgi:hypothetical protein
MRPFADCVKATALGYAALKTGLKCSFTARKLRFSPVFALPGLRSLRFHGVFVAGFAVAACFRG